MEVPFKRFAAMQASSRNCGWGAIERFHAGLFSNRSVRGAKSKDSAASASDVKREWGNSKDSPVMFFEGA